MTHDSAIDMEQFEGHIEAGPPGGPRRHGRRPDVPSSCPEPAYNASATWKLVTRQAGRFCGGAIISSLLKTLAPEVRLEWLRAAV